MRKHLTFPALLLVLPAAAMAHHGWGSYDASRTVVVEGPIQASAYSNPHATITVKGADKVWTVTLAPVSRMQVRGASAELVGVGKTVKAEGYVSKVEPDEMRAERITVDGKTVEMR
jgi:archaeosine-15-forming tRNA-guanine transglycosylase